MGLHVSNFNWGVLKNKLATEINKNKPHEASCVYLPFVAVFSIVISVYSEEQEGKNSFFSTMASIRSE